MQRLIFSLFVKVMVHITSRRLTVFAIILNDNYMTTVVFEIALMMKTVAVP